MRNYILISLLILYNNVKGQNFDCGNDKPETFTETFDLNRDGQSDLVELITCKNEGIPQLKICIYTKSSKTKGNELVNEIIGKGLEGYVRPEMLLSSKLIKLRMFVDTRFEPSGVEQVGTKTSFYLKLINDNWVYYGSINKNYNSERDVENINLRKGNISDPPFSSDSEIFESQQIPKQLLDSLDYYHKYFNEENKTKRYIKTLRYTELETMGFVNFDLINIQTVQKLNDIGYFLVEAKQFDQAIYLLQRVKDEFPNRTVIYLNLGDAYYGASMKKNSKEAYNKYIDLMKKSGKEAKIPQRVLERTK